MSRVETKASNTITLRGSAQIVTEYFGYAINSILYQRGIYDPNTFTTVKKYDLKMFVSTDDALSNYLSKVLTQLQSWLEKGIVKKLVLVISSVEKSEVLERWTFDVDTDQKSLEAGAKGKQKDEKEINKEISAIIRQIFSSVSFLPMLEGACSFDLLVYTHAGAEVPVTWEESDPKYIAKSNEVRLRDFTTKIHKVATSVAYKADS